jgi:hypothetical protein
MTAPRPASRWTLASPGNRLMYSVVAAWLLSWATTTGVLRLGLFLATVGVGYLLLTLLHHLTTDRPPKGTP